MDNSLNDNKSSSQLLVEPFKKAKISSMFHHNHIQVKSKDVQMRDPPTALGNSSISPIRHRAKRSPPKTKLTQEQLTAHEKYSHGGMENNKKKNYEQILWARKLRS